VLRDEEGTVLAEVAQELGSTTNNVAEYFALIMALEEALKLRAEEVVVESDSLLLVRQRQGAYKVRDVRLQRLEQWVCRLQAGFRSVTYRHIPREANERADALARQALRKPSEKEG
jgi:ribonuclease HI